MKPLSKKEDKFLVNLSLTEGRRRESAQTLWVHSEDLARIPLFDNACFILALFRSKTRELFQEGIERLRRFLPFQAPHGGFPRYLHDYPHAQDRTLCVHLLVPLFWIDKLFSPMLPLPLREELKSSLERLYQWCLRAHLDRPFPRTIYAKLAAVGKMVDPKCLLIWDPLCQPRSSGEWGDVLLSSQILGQEKRVFPHALKEWNASLGVYLGAPLFEFQERNHPELTLLSLIMASACNSYPDYLCKPHPFHINAALVFPEDCETYEHVHREKTALSTLITFPLEESCTRKGAHLIRYFWKEESLLHSLVCQDKHHLFERIEEGVYVFTYPMQLPPDKLGVELSFFTDYLPHVTIFVNKERATLFHLGDTVSIKTSSRTVSLHFSLVEGEGTFCGHISRGNRPSQRIREGYAAYDWKIDLRTVRRSEHLKLKCVLSFEGVSTLAK